MAITERPEDAALLPAPDFATGNAIKTPTFGAALRAHGRAELDRGRALISQESLAVLILTQFDGGPTEKN